MIALIFILVIVGCTCNGSPISSNQLAKLKNSTLQSLQLLTTYEREWDKKINDYRLLGSDLFQDIDNKINDYMKEQRNKKVQGPERCSQEYIDSTIFLMLQMDDAKKSCAKPIADEVLPMLEALNPILEEGQAVLSHLETLTILCKRIDSNNVKTCDKMSGAAESLTNAFQESVSRTSNQDTQRYSNIFPKARDCFLPRFDALSSKIFDIKASLEKCLAQ